MNGLSTILGGLCLGLFIYLILCALMDNLKAQLYTDVNAFLADWVKAQSDVNVAISSDLDEIREYVKNDDKLLKKLDDIEKSINLKTQMFEDYKNSAKKDNSTD